jgi:hypothetical protein
MANSAVVTALATSQVRKSEYRGNVQWIPVELTLTESQGTTSLVLSDVMPPNTELIAINLESTAIPGTTNTLDIGVTGNPDAILDGIDVSSAANVTYPAAATAGTGAPIDVSGKAIIGELIGAPSGDTINGYILIVTDE